MAIDFFLAEVTAAPHSEHSEIVCATSTAVESEALKRMAWARQPDAPQLSTCPMETLEPKETQYISLSSIYGLPVGGAIGGVIPPILFNIHVRRPIYAGIWRHILFGVIGGYLGLCFRDLRAKEAEESDALLRHYISLHPEDFPKYDKKLYKEIIQPWKPVR